MEYVLTDFHGNTNEQFKQAFEALRENPGSTLLIPHGTYILTSPDGQTLQKRLMEGEFGFNPHMTLFNYHFPYPEPVLDFDGMKDITVKGDDATIICDGFTRIAYIKNAENITLEGITFDYFRRPYTSGKIVDIQEDYYDFEVFDTRMVSEASPAPRALIYDIKAGCYGGYQNAQVHSEERLEQVAENVFRLRRRVEPKYLGAPVAIQHTWHSVSTVGIYEAKNVHLSRIHVLSAFGMGIVAQNAENVYLDQCKVGPAEGDYFSTNTDASHFASCSGVLECKNCHFEGSGDDGMNVHGYYESILSVSGHQAKTRFSRFCTHGVMQTYPRVGDLLELVDPSTLLVADTFRVVDVETERESVTTFLTLDKEIPKDAVGWLFCNCTRVPSLRLIDSTVKNVIALGVRLHTKDSVIKGCRIEHASLAAINICVEPCWYESGPAENILIENNDLVLCGRTAFHLDKACGVVVCSEAEEQVPIHKNIRLINNRIQTFDGQPAMHITCVDGLLLQGNVGGDVLIEKCLSVESDL